MMSESSSAASSEQKKFPVDPNETYGCKHYKRKCKFYTPCCQKTYRCRFCHDFNENHHLQREDVVEVVCSDCGLKQGLRPQCEECGTVFGKYFCFECKLYDDEDKEQFHCEGCGICRIGGRDNFFHCQKCDMCLPAHLSNGRHRCIENLSRANCPICQEDIHTSREPSQIPPCNHLIHKSCFDQLVRSGHFNCPVCQHSLVDMTDMWRLYDEQIRDTPMPIPYQGLWCSMHCQDCHFKGRTEYHILGLKCPECNGYNTVRHKGPYYKQQGDTFVEVHFTHEMLPSINRTIHSSGRLQRIRRRRSRRSLLRMQNQNSPDQDSGMSSTHSSSSEEISPSSSPQHETGNIGEMDAVQPSTSSASDSRKKQNSS